MHNGVGFGTYLNGEVFHHFSLTIGLLAFCIDKYYLLHVFLYHFALAGVHLIIFLFWGDLLSLFDTVGGLCGAFQQHVYHSILLA